MPIAHLARRKSLRLRNFDYATQGAYFITICTAGRRSAFGRIRDGQMLLGAAGRVAHACWSELPRHYENVVLDYFIVMPNHVHGVVFLRGADGAGFKPAPTRAVVPISEIVRAFKTFSARRINDMFARSGAVWQRNYYERVVRNDRELEAIREYVLNNPAKWEFDRENPECRSERKLM